MIHTPFRQAPNPLPIRGSVGFSSPGPQVSPYAQSLGAVARFQAYTESPYAKVQVFPAVTLPGGAAALQQTPTALQQTGEGQKASTKGHETTSTHILQLLVFAGLCYVGYRGMSR